MAQALFTRAAGGGLAPRLPALCHEEGTLVARVARASHPGARSDNTAHRAIERASFRIEGRRFRCGCGGYVLVRGIGVMRRPLRCCRGSRMKRAPSFAVGAGKDGALLPHAVNVGPRARSNGRYAFIAAHASNPRGSPATPITSS
jgi:hypothetical protein